MDYNLSFEEKTDYQTNPPRWEQEKCLENKQKCLKINDKTFSVYHVQTHQGEENSFGVEQSFSPLQR